jgi:hypothetical protein
MLLNSISLKNEQSCAIFLLTTGVVMHDYAAMTEGYCMQFKCKQMNNKGNYPT